MKIYVDADACPNIVKNIIFRAAQRCQVHTLLLANHTLRIPPSPFIRFIQVPGGFDVVDKQIIEKVLPGDLVITADIPLAAFVIEKGAHALNPRGELYTPDNIQQRLSLRNFMEDVRSSGQTTRGPAPLHPRDQQQFANMLDKLLSNQ